MREVEEEGEGEEGGSSTVKRFLPSAFRTRAIVCEGGRVVGGVVVARAVAWRLRRGGGAWFGLGWELVLWCGVWGRRGEEG